VFIAGGILEIQPNHVTVLADTAIRGEDLDEARALEAKARAEEQLANNNADIDYARAQAELALAVAEIAAINKLRKK
jgi:F-type H+-transporting ATPase subunit epsilon